MVATVAAGSSAKRGRRPGLWGWVRGGILGGEWVQLFAGGSLWMLWPVFVMCETLRHIITRELRAFCIVEVASWAVIAADGSRRPDPVAS
jgi:hypothetical protein